MERNREIYKRKTSVTMFSERSKESPLLLPLHGEREGGKTEERALHPLMKPDWHT